LVRAWKKFHFVVAEFSASVNVAIPKDVDSRELYWASTSGARSGPIPMPFPRPIQTAAGLSRRNAAIARPAACLAISFLHFKKY